MKSGKKRLKMKASEEKLKRLRKGWKHWKKRKPA